MSHAPRAAPLGNVMHGGDNHGFVTNEVAVAATTFLVWDTIIHIGDEVEYVWSRGSISWIQFSYVFVRHIPYLAQGAILTLVAAPQSGRTWASMSCEDWIIAQFAMVEAITLAVEAVLIIRVYAMYNCSRLILFTILFLFTIEVAAMITILSIAIPGVDFSDTCLIISAPSILSSYWICSLVFETVLFALTLVKFFRSVAVRLGKRSVLFVLVRDGIWAYAIIFVIMLLNTLMYHLAHNALAGICFFPEISVMSFAGSHVLLNLRRLAIQSNRRELTTLTLGGTMQFTPHVSHRTSLVTDDGLDGATVYEMHDLTPV
ncbi:hypothetical protein CERSUDRAFT_117073 [Gelatoporia subvermispora B]|uniref:DUF6533 domain-containing protein n=1 Tax=Ceriporiopsis subvermispora (strain B) TaxID=914234 RepID=M2R8X7_CERS8|nr:hypothetical protein CERSUDRAFT_117073 [Gelatoporia subvermispora B]